MKQLLIISFLLINYCYGQMIIVNGHKHAGTPPTPPTRLLIDLGGNGSGDNGFTDTGVMTPDNTNRRGQDANGKWWNNITNGFPGTLLSNPVDTAGNVYSGFSIAIDAIPRGTFSSDSSMNFAGWTSGAVGDYVVTATQDNLYFHYSANGGSSGAHGIVTMTITIPDGDTCDIKFWGSRVVVGGLNRDLEIKKSTDVSWQSYRANNNSDYNHAVTLTGLTGTAQVQFRVAAGLDLAHLSVMDIRRY